MCHAVENAYVSFLTAESKMEFQGVAAERVLLAQRNGSGHRALKFMGVHATVESALAALEVFRDVQFADGAEYTFVFLSPVGEDTWFGWRHGDWYSFESVTEQVRIWGGREHQEALAAEPIFTEVQANEAIDHYLAILGPAAVAQRGMNQVMQIMEYVLVHPDHLAGSPFEAAFARARRAFPGKDSQRIAKHTMIKDIVLEVLKFAIANRTASAAPPEYDSE